MNEVTRINPIRLSGGTSITPDVPDWMPYEEYVKTYGAFMKYVMSVWVNENTVPTEQPDLAVFDVDRLLPEYQIFLDSGRELPKQGNTIEEMWLALQLWLRGPVTCLINSNQPEQPVGRISRLRVLSSDEIWSELHDFFANQPESDVEPTAIVLVYDGDKIAHALVALNIQDNELHFFDPWPGRSLLCEENNSAGVKARESFLREYAWRISEDEFQRVVFSVFPIPQTILSDRKRFLSEEKKRKEDEFQHFIMFFHNLVNRPYADDLIKMGFKPFSKLEAAAIIGNIEMLKELINNGQDVNQKGNIGYPLNLAAEFGHLEAVKLLIEYGADFHLLNDTGETAADAAQERGHIAVAEYLHSL